jgi:FkbH-like protein
VGLERWFNPLQWNAYKLPFDAVFGPLYADCLARLIGALRGKSRKCLVLDLDNTLWGGAIGDEGLDGIVLGEGSALGEAFLSVQRYALSLRQRGIILAVSSKNDDANARMPFQSHPDMLLKENHIAVFQANWIDKASNLEAVAKTLNIGVDALVLLDDNPAERAAVRAALPMVAVPELPSDPARYVEILDAAGYFEAVELSGDDLLRADAIQSNALRADVMQRAQSIEDYLGALEMKLSLSAFRPEERQRITQLANKTNQFNLTTRRYAESEIAALEANTNAFTLQARLRDRFGDMGLISLLIAKPDPGDETAWDVETWLMSCRVLGREVERGVLEALVQAARKKGVRKLRGTYIPTPKNGMVAEHYRKLGFAQNGSEPDGRSSWELDVTSHEPAKLPFKLAE